MSKKATKPPFVTEQETCIRKSLDGKRCGQCGTLIEEGCCGFAVSEILRDAIRTVENLQASLDQFKDDLEVMLGEQIENQDRAQDHE